MSDFEDSPSCQTVTINNVSREVQIVTITNSSKENYKRILSKPNETFNVGDIVVWDGMTFLITDIDEDQQIQTKGTIQLCNNILSFYSTADSTLYSIPCIIGNKVNLKTDESKYITTVSNELYLTISNTSINRQIQVGDIFTIGLSNYKISTVCDDISVVGLLIFKVEYSEELQENHVYTVTILNTDAILHINNTLALDVICTDNSQVVTSPTITYLSSDTDVATVLNGVITCLAEGTVIITTTFNSVSDTLNLTVQSEVIPDNYTVLVSGSSTVKLNSNITLTSTVFNNGAMDESKSVTWSFSNQDGSSNVYVTLVSSTGSSITLKATSNNAYVNKYVVVRGTKSDDVLVYDEHLVQIKSLF